jgi:hypothetical protein
MRVIRLFGMVLLAVTLASAAPAWAAAPTHSTSHAYVTGAVAEYQLPTGAWWVSFGIGRYTVDGQQLEQPTVTVGIWESSCSPDGRTCSAYALDGSAVVPAEAITIAANLGRAVLAPVEVTAAGSACESWFDDALGSWQSQCTEITQTTTVSATLTATGPVGVSRFHETSRSDGPFRYRFTINDVTRSRPATATATAFGHTSDDPVTARIASQLTVGTSTWWELQS